MGHGWIINVLARVEEHARLNELWGTRDAVREAKAKIEEELGNASVDLQHKKLLQLHDPDSNVYVFSYSRSIDRAVSRSENDKDEPNWGLL